MVYTDPIFIILEFSSFDSNRYFGLQKKQTLPFWEGSAFYLTGQCLKLFLKCRQEARSITAQLFQLAGFSVCLNNEIPAGTGAFQGFAVYWLQLSFINQR